MNTNERDWMYKRWFTGGIFNLNYEQGDEMFLDFAFSRLGIVSSLEILCPCNQCADQWSMKQDEVKKYLYYYELYYYYKLIKDFYNLNVLKFILLLI